MRQTICSTFPARLLVASVAPVVIVENNLGIFVEKFVSQKKSAAIYRPIFATVEETEIVEPIQ